MWFNTAQHLFFICQNIGPIFTLGVELLPTKPQGNSHRIDPRILAVQHGQKKISCSCLPEGQDAHESNVATVCLINRDTLADIFFTQGPIGSSNRVRREMDPTKNMNWLPNYLDIMKTEFYPCNKLIIIDM